MRSITVAVTLALLCPFATTAGAANNEPVLFSAAGVTVPFRKALVKGANVRVERLFCRQWRGQKTAYARRPCPSLDQVAIVNGGTNCRGQLNEVHFVWDGSPEPYWLNGKATTITPQYRAYILSDDLQAIVQPRFRSALGSDKNCPPPGHKYPLLGESSAARPAADLPNVR
jgi:hypothetical protein